MTASIVLAVWRDVIAVLCPAAVLLPCVIVVIVLHVRRVRRDPEILRKWASRKGIALEEVEPRRLRCGRYTFCHNVLQRVYRIRATDADGRTYTGLVCIGGGLGGGGYVAEDWEGDSPENVAEETAWRSKSGR